MLNRIILFGAVLLFFCNCEKLPFKALVKIDSICLEECFTPGIIESFEIISPLNNSLIACPKSDSLPCKFSIEVSLDLNTPATCDLFTYIGIQSLLEDSIHIQSDFKQWDNRLLSIDWTSTAQFGTTILDDPQHVPMDGQRFKVIAILSDEEIIDKKLKNLRSLLDNCIDIYETQEIIVTITKETTPCYHYSKLKEFFVSSHLDNQKVDCPGDTSLPCKVYLQGILQGNHFDACDGTLLQLVRSESAGPYYVQKEISPLTFSDEKIYWSSQAQLGDLGPLHPAEGEVFSLVTIASAAADEILARDTFSHISDIEYPFVQTEAIQVVVRKP